MPTMLPVVLVLVGLFLAGFCLIGLPRGLRQIVAGAALVVMSLTVAAVPPAAVTPASEPPGRTFTMQVTSP